MRRLVSHLLSHVAEHIGPTLHITGMASLCVRQMVITIAVIRSSNVLPLRALASIVLRGGHSASLQVPQVLSGDMTPAALRIAPLVVAIMIISVASRPRDPILASLLYSLGRDDLGLDRLGLDGRKLVGLGLDRQTGKFHRF